MQRAYDIFERFPNGSSKWRTFVCGEYDAQRILQGLAEHSENEFFAIDIQAGGLLPINFARSNSSEQVKNTAKRIA
jgi:hypothetical protein